MESLSVSVCVSEKRTNIRGSGRGGDDLKGGE